MIMHGEKAGVVRKRLAIVRYRKESTCLAMILLLGLAFPETIKATHDTLYICPGDSLTLRATPGFATYRWQPAQGLSNPTIADPVAIPQATTTYIVEAIPALGRNLIANGDFSEGNTGFASDYTYSAGANPTQGVYGVFDNANDLSPMFFQPCRDHTDGSSGLMMVVDGSPIPDQQVWCTTIAIEPNTTYAFTTWLTSILQPNPAALRFSINGEQIGATFRAGTINCQWQQFYATWTSGDATEAEICVVNQNTNPNGNDFALDDFGFFEIGASVLDTFTVVVYDSPTVMIDTTFCEGATIEYEGQFIPVRPSFSLTYATANGCDSTVIYRAEIIDTVTIVNRVDTLCPGDTLRFRGQLIDRDTLICASFTSATGCDTTVCLQAVYLTETALEMNLTDPTCFGREDGLIDLQVVAGLPPYRYSWEDGSINADRQGLPAGQYRVQVTDSKGCQATRQVELTQPMRLIATATTNSVICNGDVDGRIRIHAQGGTAPYRISIDGGQPYESDQLFNGLDPGLFSIVVQDTQDCRFDFTVAVPEPMEVNLQVPQDVEIRLGERIQVMISDNALSELSYQWIPAEGVDCPTCALTEVMPLSTTRYQIVASDSLGCKYDTTWLVSVDRQNSIYIPNAFSPNGDGVNDEFRVFPGLGVAAVLELLLYDRWGNRIFQSYNCGASCSWSGMLQGQVAPPGIYTYAIRIEFIDGKTRWLSGEIQLLN